MKEQTITIGADGVTSSDPKHLTSTTAKPNLFRQNSSKRRNDESDDDQQVGLFCFDSLFVE